MLFFPPNTDGVELLLSWKPGDWKRPKKIGVKVHLKKKEFVVQHKMSQFIFKYFFKLIGHKL